MAESKEEAFIPDTEAGEPLHNEPDIQVPADTLPRPAEGLTASGSMSELRLAVEQLLERREAPPPEAWQALGDPARELLLRLLDDVVIARRPALRQRIIATLGQLKVQRAIPRLGAILLDASEDPITRAQCASALGSTESEQAIRFLSQAVGDREDVVRRQIAHALAKINHPDAVAPLVALLRDPAPHVVEVAADALRARQGLLGLDLGVVLPPAGPPRTAVNIQPLAD